MRSLRDTSVQPSVEIEPQTFWSCVQCPIHSSTCCCLTFGGGKVIMLTTHTNPWGKSMWASETTMLTAHFTSDLMSAVLIFKQKKVWSYMTPMCLPFNNTSSKLKSILALYLLFIWWEFELPMASSDQSGHTMALPTHPDGLVAIYSVIWGDTCLLTYSLDAQCLMPGDKEWVMDGGHVIQ